MRFSDFEKFKEDLPRKVLQFLDQEKKLTTKNLNMFLTFRTNLE